LWPAQLDRATVDHDLDRAEHAHVELCAVDR
jgi:hypothetical protein